MINKPNLTAQKSSALDEIVPGVYMDPEEDYCVDMYFMSINELYGWAEGEVDEAQVS